MHSQGTTSYGWDSAAAPQSFSVITPAVLRVLRKTGARRVLDLGAGNGVLCRRLRAEGYDVVGVEIDEQGVALARSNCPDIAFHRLGVDDDPMLLLEREGPFDAVVSTEVVEHLYAPHRLPAFARAVLRPHGWLVLTTPYHGFVKNLALSLLDHWDTHHAPLWCGGHIKFWSRRTLSQLLVDGGFDVHAFVGIGRVPYLWKSMLLAARVGPVPGTPANGSSAAVRSNGRCTPRLG